MSRQPAPTTRAHADESVNIVPLNATALRGGKLIEDVSGVFGAHAFLTLGADSGSSVQQLRDALGANLTRVIDLFHELDENGDGKVGKREFRRALARIVDSPPSQEDSDVIFNSFDMDESGAIEYKELHTLRARTPPQREPWMCMF